MKKLGNLCLLLVLTMLLVNVVNAEETNLLTNGDFEVIADSKPDGWYSQVFKPYSGIAVATDKSYSGKYSLKIENKKENDARLIQYVNVKPNTTYCLSGWIKVEDVPEGKIGANLSIITSADRSESINGNKDWTLVKYYFKTNASQKGIAIGPRLGTWGNINSGTAYFDDLSLTEAVGELGSYKKLTVNNEIRFSQIQKQKKLKKYLYVSAMISLLLIGGLFWLVKKISRRYQKKA